ncbi:MAG: hypothetical protein AAF944_24390 [Bacteroidota bacterium]
MKLLDKLLINEEFIYTGNLEELERDLRVLEDKSILIQKLDEQKIKFKSTFSWGTLKATDGFQVVEGINVMALTNQLDENLLKLKFITKLRPEHYFIAALYILFIAIMIVQKEEVWVCLLLFGLWIVFHICFHWVYRMQERTVIKSVVNGLKLKEYNS